MKRLTTASQLVLFLVLAVALVSCRESPESIPDEEADPPSPSTMGFTEAGSAPEEVRGQLLYVPVYSHIFHINEERTFGLTATLSIRNISLTDTIIVREIGYYNSEGQLLKSYLEAPRQLGPLSSTYVVIEERDRSGGVGANFIVEWRGRQPVVPPMVEAVMISTSSTQGISFTSPSRVLREW